MPKSGYGSITVRTELLESLKEIAKQHNRSVPKELENLIECQKQKEA